MKVNGLYCSSSPGINGNGEVLKEELLIMGLNVGAFDPADPGDGIVEAEVLDHCGDHHAGTASAARAMNNTVSPLQKCFKKAVTLSISPCKRIEP